MKGAIIISIILSVGLANCTTYEEGPGFTLRTAQARLTNTWEVDKALTDNGTDVTQDYNETLQLSFKKDGLYEMIYILFGIKSVFPGSWEFSKDRQEVYTEVSFQYMGQTHTELDTLHIWKLEKKELWLEVSDTSYNNQSLVFYMSPVD